MRKELSWHDVPFCNCIIPKIFFEKFGLPSEEYPWDLDDFEFCRRVKKNAKFMNIPELIIRHDRYPDSLRKFLLYKWKLRVRTGEKIILYPEFYYKMIPVIFITLLPWLILLSILALPLKPLQTILSILIIYAGFLLTQIPSAVKASKNKPFLYLGVMFGLHLFTALGIQAGLVRGILKRLKILKKK